ncbi:two-component system activity regulator YycH [Anoxynatronum sibiricum]|uniref:Two-component system activity regulator YycH n=1 Tax=Anoxynatronum sibiricum TaxID=210623 RepID=A0ABU9VVJ2_9CLOT
MMHKEKLKSLLLTFLVVTSVVLTQRVWFHSPLQLITSEASYLEEAEILEQERARIIRPVSIVAGFGGGVENSHYSLIKPQDLDRFWQELQVILKDHFISEPTVQVVSYEDYQQVKGSRSIELHFAEGFPAALLATLYDQQENQVTAVLSQISRVLIPGRYLGTLYMVDEVGTTYEFRITQQQMTAATDPGELLDSIPVNSYVKYYPLFSYAGNEVLLPLTHQNNLPRLFTESEVDVSSDQQMNLWAGRFFNENFDFVKTIQETGGTRIYMYGYGQQEVRITNRGRLEYTAETGNQSSTSVGKALDTALLFMARHGGLNADLVLQEVKLLEHNNQRGYRFTFSYRLRELPVALSRQQQPVEIDVYGNSVRSYRTFIRRPMSLPEVLPESGILSPHRLVEENFNQLLAEMAAARGFSEPATGIDTTTPPGDETARDPENAAEPEREGLQPALEQKDSTESLNPTDTVQPNAQEPSYQPSAESSSEAMPAPSSDHDSGTLPETSSFSGDELLQAIESIELIYLDREDTHRRQLMVPVWRLIIENRVYDYDAHEGVRINTFTLTEREL